MTLPVYLRIRCTATPYGTAGYHESEENPASDGQVQSFLPNQEGKSVSPDGQSTQNKQCSRESPAKRIRMLRPTDGTADRYHISAV